MAPDLNLTVNCRQMQLLFLHIGASKARVRNSRTSKRTGCSESGSR